MAPHINQQDIGLVVLAGYHFMVNSTDLQIFDTESNTYVTIEQCSSKMLSEFEKKRSSAVRFGDDGLNALEKFLNSHVFRNDD